MTVLHLRIDNRLIHGQVTVGWVGMLGANELVVADDNAAQSSLESQLLKASARGVSTQVLAVRAAAEYCLSESSGGRNVLVVTRSPVEALALLEDGVRPREINVGNQAPSPGVKSKRITKTVAATQSDANSYRRMHELCDTITCRMMPGDKARDMLQLLAKAGL